MASEVKSKAGLLKHFNSCTQEVQEYFQHVPKLVDGLPLDVCLAYVFSRLELGQNMALYCGCLKVHRTNSNVTREAISTQYMTREKFVDLYFKVFEIALPKSAKQRLRDAEKTRDSVMHGKNTTDQQLRTAIARALDYAEAVNKQLVAKFGFKPFGKLRGFAGAAKKYDKKASTLMLKGLGFELQES